MKISMIATVVATVLAASIGLNAAATTYTDSTFDLFDNGLDNLDISGVDISDDGTNLSIAITTDTMRLAGAGTTGTRSLAANGTATALKITSTEWIIEGTGLS